MIRTVGAFGLAAGATRAVYAGLRRRRDERWERKNHAGRTVDLYAGPATAVGAVLGALPAGAGRRERAAAAVAGLVAGACGAYDDVNGDHRRGFRAHLGALREGEVTSGAVKLFGIGAAGLVAGALLKERPVDRVLAGVVIAGTAHLVNLVDVRPGRAVLTVLAVGVPGLARGRLAAAPMGAAAAVAADDLGERTMLGDAGAHALGAVLGTAIAAAAGRAGLAAHAAGLVAVAAYGDTVSRLAGSPG
ncbi:hypothetical protein [Streptomyces lavendofoliae]|uniref:UDP-N-acetylmuramyl pentapeptide phosphotransferase/UDP-N-acetylglucosamine-1-phosphate transferase n=1 Tax=Streptomyces lavendofoliae TaxID=67314 RepID=A0A918M762_9ACTN|nr:hypothetical protein [Streptomyces lavendofoliae]GGU56221.1 hypothetical protein GCM10010274_51660 [Streptomyces lavendofoliae]